jgi:hypothetical protein
MMVCVEVEIRQGVPTRGVRIGAPSRACLPEWCPCAVSSLRATCSRSSAFVACRRSC